jgi:hypothetical protein
MPDVMLPPDRQSHRDTIILVVTYALGLIAAAALLYPHFSFFEGITETESGAYFGFASACVVLAGVVPMVVLPILLVTAAVRRRPARIRAGRSEE